MSNKIVRDWVPIAVKTETYSILRNIKESEGLASYDVVIRRLLRETGKA